MAAIFKLSNCHIFKLIFFYPDIPEFYHRTMAQKAYVAGSTANTGMIFVIEGAIAACCGDITFRNNISVKDYLDNIAFYDHLFIVPFPGRF